MSLVLQDTYNRSILYLRLSLTERCNLACKYCLPFGYNHVFNDEELTLNEIYQLVKAFSELGVTKIRLTGGEPTLRKDFLDIVKKLKSIPEIKTLCVTTNGINLLDKAKDFYLSGIDTINISLDTLNSDNFKWITGYKNLNKVLQAIDLCLKLPFKKVKINTVLLKDFIKKEFPIYMEYVKYNDLDIRFIELMLTNINKDFYNSQHVISSEVEYNLLNQGWVKLEQEDYTAGPAYLYTHKDYKGRIGFITPYSNKFCSHCNRVRVNSIGELQLCLFGKQKFSLRPYLQNSKDRDKLKGKIIQLLKLKPKQHFLEDNNIGLGNSFSKIGG